MELRAALEDAWGSQDLNGPKGEGDLEGWDRICAGGL